MGTLEVQSVKSDTEVEIVKVLHLCHFHISILIYKPLEEKSLNFLFESPQPFKTVKKLNQDTVYKAV